MSASGVGREADGRGDEAVQALFPELEIEELIGKGGMGAVYRARQPRLQRLVALKVLAVDGTGQEDFGLRFEREARTLAGLNHPNIVTIHDFGERDGLCYLLMEHVDGSDLRRMLESGPLPQEQALAIFRQVCDGLQAAHDCGVTHRDIKPANLLVGSDGRVRLADFGLAKRLRGADQAAVTNLTVTGISMGTAAYAAPEQLRNPETADHRADIFSLGVLLYELLTGERPVGAFRRPSEKAAVDPRLDAVVMRAMDEDRARRYQRVDEFRDAVFGIVDSRRHTSWRRRWPIGGAAGLAVVSIWAFAAGPWKSGNASIESGPAESAGAVKPAESSHLGRLRGAGTNAFHRAPDLSAAEPFDDFIDVVNLRHRWVALRANGQTVSSDGSADFAGVRRIVGNPGNGWGVIGLDGWLKVDQENDAGIDELPPEIMASHVVDAALGFHHGIALTKEGRVLAFGPRYERQVWDPADADGYGTPQWPFPPESALEGVVDLAATSTHAAGLKSDGSLVVWGWEGVLDLDVPPELRKIRAVVGSGDSLWLLGSNGVVSRLALPRNPSPEQPNRGAPYFVQAATNADQVARWSWLEKSGSWREWEPGNSKLLASEVPSGIRRISPSGGIMDGRLFFSVLWIEPAAD